jgi:UDP-N-acetylglucosamine--N-acetylmuramyl-(pentapeptide) pyrophosphoryl-undecaprenol N-acetylglucosamine transferase
MFFTGGYLAVPMALAGRYPGFGSPRPRSALFVPDIEPGLALRTLSRFAESIAVITEEAKDFFPSHKNVQITGYPTRKDLDIWNLDDARKTLGLRDDLKTLLVFGGSRGARSINQALFPGLPKLLEVIQIVHISGKANWAEVDSGRQSLPPKLSERYHPYPYLYAEMGAALTAADLVLSRAGAATMGEFPLFGVPAVLVPYPYAWRYQLVNAEYLAKHGAAVMIQDAELEEKLTSVVIDLIQNPGRLERMSKAMQSLSRPDAADTIAKILLDLANTTNLKRIDS